MSKENYTIMVGDQIKAVASRMKAVRERLGKTQAEFAEATGVSRSFLSEMEAGKSKPSVQLLIGVAEAFPAIGRDWILTGNGLMTVYDTDPDVPSDWAGTLRLYSDVSLSNVDTDALRCAIRCLEIVIANAPKRRKGELERKLILQFYARYAGAYQDAMRVESTKSDPHLYASANCEIYASELSRLPWESLIETAHSTPSE